jgi:hypothetical protein
VKKLQAAANARTTPKATPAPVRLPRSRAKTKKQQWNPIPSSEASFERLSTEPNTTVLLSADEAEWVRSIERSAEEDPQAYLEACRSGKL